jgi:hypothetical protein
MDERRKKSMCNPQICFRFKTSGWTRGIHRSDVERREVYKRIPLGPVKNKNKSWGWYPRQITPSHGSVKHVGGTPLSKCVSVQ